jgi:uncharacterized membrane protein
VGPCLVALTTWQFTLKRLIGQLLGTLALLGIFPDPSFKGLT